MTDIEQTPAELRARRQGPAGGIEAGAELLTEPVLAPGGGGADRVEREFTVKARSQSSLVIRRFLQHKLAVGSLVVLVLLVVASIVGQSAWKYTYDVFSDDLSMSPDGNHPFGTDAEGYDMLARTFRGVQTSMIVGLIVATLSTAFGTLYGAVAGYYGGVVDAAMMRVVDLVLTLPALAILILLSIKFAGGGSPIVLALILASLSWAPISRVIRGLFLSLREKEFIEAARALGANDRRIILRHLLPNAVGPIIVNATITVAVAILAEAGLSFLGFGIKSPEISLGALISTGVSAANTRPWLFYLPGLVLIIIPLTINFIGDGLRDAFDPQQQRVRA